MQERGLVYGYGVVTEERHEQTLDTMPSWIEEYVTIETNKSTPDRIVQDIFFTNLFVSRVNWWFGDDVQRLLHAIESSGNIYLHRWGDAPIQSTALKLFAKPGTIARLPTAYLHASTMDRVFSDGSITDGWFDREMQ
eukprot:3463704-Prymnesium_polylepis.1